MCVCAARLMDVKLAARNFLSGYFGEMKWYRARRSID